MDRKPTPPPFPVGVRVRYLGTRKVTAGDTGAIVLAPGIEVEIVDTHKGRRGTMHVIDAGSLHGEPAFDRTVDGYSVYNSPIGRRCIWPRDRGEWELVDPKSLAQQEDVHERDRAARHKRRS